MSSRFRHVELQALAPGVWAAIHRHGGWAIGNAGIVDLGGTTLVFDTLLTPEAARELRAAAVERTGRAPGLVVNSHYHNDHTRGNQVFPEATIIATAATRELFLKRGREELEHDRENAPAQLERISAQRGADRAADFFGPYLEGIVASLAELELRAPELTVTGETSFHGRDRRARLLPCGGGHSGDDSVLLLPDDGVVFCADLLFVETHPYLPDGDPAALLAAGERLAALGAEHYVPGHGPVAGAEAFAAQRGYLETLTALAAEASADDLAATPVPAAYRDWELGVPFFAANLRFLHALAGSAADR